MQNTPAQAQAAPNPKQVIRVHDGGTDEVVEIHGRLLTAEGGELRVSNHLRSVVAFSENGELLVSRSHLEDPHVLSFEERIRQQGYRVERRFAVDMKTVSEAYNAANTDTVSKLKSEQTVNMRELLRIIRVAAEQKASDIHVIVSGETATVRMRVDGVLYTQEEFTSAKGFELCGTAFSMADAADSTYNPYDGQDARISAQSADLPRSVQSVRIRWNPLAFGGRFMVMRLLYTSAGGQKSAGPGDLAKLGYLPVQLELLERVRAHPMGINIIAGPVNSGKSTTVAITLDQLLRESNYEKSCQTVEDPPEYVITGAQQMPVTNAKTSEQRTAKFQQAIEGMLRSDPNIILIGEIRGPESAKLAFQGAMTGTQVWTSLHANTALGILDRLRDIGVENYKLCDPTVVTGLIGQRLLKVLCPHCKEEMKAALAAGRIDAPRAQRTEQTLDAIGRPGHTVWCRGPGCDSCGNTGYSGRTAASEIIQPDDGFMDLIRRQEKTAARHYWLREMGGVTMLMHALHKLLDGQVGPSEIEAAVDLVHADEDVRNHFHSYKRG